MSLNGLLNIGGTALAVNQAAIQTTGNNIANVSNPDYTRQIANQSTAPDTKLGPGQFVGNGVQLDGVARQIDEALQARLNGATSDASNATTSQDWLGRVQSVFNELSDSDLSTKLSTFFKGWSDLANKPQDAGLRQIVLQNATSVTDWFHEIGTNLQSLQGDLNDQVKAQAEQANGDVTQIAALNAQITAADGGNASSGANALRDQRDAAIKDLSGIMDVTTVGQPNGATNVYIGSEPLVTNGTSNGVTTVTQTDGTHTIVKAAFATNNGVLKVTSGSLGGLYASDDTLTTTTDHVDQLASSFVFELNKIHSSGQGLDGQSTAIGATVVADPTVALTDPKSGLTQLPTNGSFVLHVKDKTTGLSTSTLIKVNLKGDANDTTLNSLIAQINAVPGVTAADNGGRLQITADDAPASELTFSDDSSGALASLGVNTFFTGTNSRDIAVNTTVQNDPNLIAAAQNGDSGDNQTALSIAKLETTPVTSLDGSTMEDSYQGMINDIASKTAEAGSEVTSTAAVTETLQNQRDAVSGVSMDEEAVNLMRYQTAYQGAARLVTVVNEMTATLMALVT